MALVDHGSPIELVSRLRDRVADQLSERLGQSVQPCSMERREGQYAFNDPLLENLAGAPGLAGGALVLAMFFLLPGVTRVKAGTWRRSPTVCVRTVVLTTW